MEDESHPWPETLGLPPQAAEVVEALTRNLALLPKSEPLNRSLSTLLEQARGSAILSDPLAAGALVRIAYAAPFLMRHLAGNPDLLSGGALADLAEGPPLLPWEPASSSQTGRNKLGAAQPGTPDESGLMTRLRVWKYANFIRLTARDLMGLQDTAATCGQISSLADEMIGIAYAHAFTSLALRKGLPLRRDGKLAAGAVVGMGKLGGRELNYSSDVDLIFISDGDDTPCRTLGEIPAELHSTDVPEEEWWGRWHAMAADAETDPKSDAEDHPEDRITSDEFHNRLARQVTRLLATPQAGGIGFRVDCDLRPLGGGGFLAPSLGFMEHYYFQQGREWERTAMLKARIVTGDVEVARRFKEMIHPFVYRRYLDYGALEGIAIVKHDIDRLNRSALERNLKLGRGGIRENEFFVQALQLLYGGKKPALQVTGHDEALSRLAKEGLLTTEEAQAVRADYWLLRRLENRIQMVSESQTHLLPEESDALARVLHDFQPGFPGRTEAVLERLEETRARNAGRFSKLFAGLVEEGFLDSEAWRQAVRDHARPGRLEADLRRIDDIFARMMTTRAGERCVFKLARLLAREEVYRPGTQQALPRWLDFFEQIGNRNAIYSLIETHPPIVPWIGEIFREGGRHTKLLIRHPEYLESFFALGDEWEALSAQFEEIAREAGDEEEFILELQNAKAQGTIRALTACLNRDTEGGPGGHTEMLSSLADATVTACTQFAWRLVGDRMGVPQGEEREKVSGISVLALGKLSSRQMRFDSDLDLVFVYRGEGTSGNGPTHYEFYTRLVQKIGTLLTAPTQFGRLYDLDHRLRPFGNKGVLVPSLAAFRNFLMPGPASGAEVWNFQAFTRIRPVCGEEALAAELVAAIAGGWRARGVSVHRIGAEVWDMLEKLVAEHRPLHRGGDPAVPLKFAVGGMIGFEFLQQAHFLAAQAATGENSGEAPGHAGARGKEEGVGEDGAGWTAPPPHEIIRRLEGEYLEIGRLDERLSFYETDGKHELRPAHCRDLRVIAKSWDFEEVRSQCSRMEAEIGKAFRDFGA